MGLWHNVRGELAGAWRSARYDAHRHRAIRRSTKLATVDTNEIQGAAPAGQPDPQRQAYGRPYGEPARPRRVLAATGVTLLVAGGAAGTYLAVAGGLTALTADPSGPPAAAPVPQPVVATVSRPLAPAIEGRRAAPGRPVQHGTPQPAARPADPAPVVVFGSTPQDSHSPEATPTPSTSASSQPPSSTEPSLSVAASHPGSYGAGQTGVGR